MTDAATIPFDTSKQDRDFLEAGVKVLAGIEAAKGYEHSPERLAALRELRVRVANLGVAVAA